VASQEEAGGALERPAPALRNLGASQHGSAWGGLFFG
jgi:hypothetical protein